MQISKWTLTTWHGQDTQVTYPLGSMVCRSEAVNENLTMCAVGNYIPVSYGLEKILIYRLNSGLRIKMFLRKIGF